MNLKEKLADWLTGGAYARNKKQCAQQFQAIKELTASRDVARETAMARTGQCEGVMSELIDAKLALHDIIAMRTENCAHIGKKMAARAEEVVGAR